MAGLYHPDLAPNDPGVLVGMLFRGIVRGRNFQYADCSETMHGYGDSSIIRNIGRIDMKNRGFTWRLMILAVAFLGCTGHALAIPYSIAYQGHLTDTQGNPIDADVAMVFRIWNDQDAGSVLWVQTQSVVQVRGGLFSVTLGVISPTIFIGDNRALSIQVGSDPEMTPRIPIQSVPFAYNAERATYAVTAGYAATSAVAQVAQSVPAQGPWYTDGTNTFQFIGNVGLWKSDPQAALHVFRYSTDSRAMIHSETRDADVIIDAGLGLPTVEFRAGGSFGGSIGYDPDNQYMFMYHNGSLVFKNNQLGIGTNNPSARLHVHGNVKVTGQAEGTFPRPNYDSGWLSYSQNQTRVLNHNLGGNLDRYMVDLQARNALGPLTYGYGYFVGSSGVYGFFYDQLSTNQIRVRRAFHDEVVEQMRVRIWIYN